MHPLVKRRLSITFFEFPMVQFAGFVMFLIYPVYKPERLRILMGICIAYVIISFFSWIWERKNGYKKLSLVSYRISVILLGTMFILPFATLMNNSYIEYGFLFYPLLFFIDARLYVKSLLVVGPLLLIGGAIYLFIVGLPFDETIFRATGCWIVGWIGIYVLVLYTNGTLIMSEIWSMTFLTDDDRGSLRKKKKEKRKEERRQRALQKEKWREEAKQREMVEK